MKAIKAKALRKTAKLRVPAASKKRQIVSAIDGADRLARLAEAVAGVASGQRARSRTARLLAAGAPKMAQKVIEEAAEVGIEAVRGDIPALVRESADLLYNLTVLWTHLGVPVAQVWAEMDRREHVYGIAEKLPKPAGEPR